MPYYRAKDAQDRIEVLHELIKRGKLIHNEPELTPELFEKHYCFATYPNIHADIVSQQIEGNRDTCSNAFTDRKEFYKAIFRETEGGNQIRTREKRGV